MKCNKSSNKCIHFSESQVNSNMFSSSSVSYCDDSEKIITQTKLFLYNQALKMMIQVTNEILFHYQLKTMIVTHKELPLI